MLRRATAFAHIAGKFAIGESAQRGGAAPPPRSSCTTAPRRRGGGASHSGWARLVVTSFSPACQRRVNAGIEKSALLAASSAGLPSCTRCRMVIVALLASARHLRRSEEHTSELQSRFDLVCRLLLEKKKKTRTEARAKAKKTMASYAAPRGRFVRKRSLASLLGTGHVAQCRSHQCPPLYCILTLCRS